MNLILAPFSFLYSQVMALRNLLYDRDVLPTFEVGIPIVSVGNLTLGGTGKTPLICELVAWALENKLHPGVVSRGYRGQVRGVELVTPNGDPSYFGDEPVMIASRFANVPVYVGADRVAAVKKMIEHQKVDIIFADDAFQHRRLGRKADIVVVDCTEAISNYRVVPVGRARENVRGLDRADFIILNKVNLATPEQKKIVLEFLEEHSTVKGTPIIEAEYYVRNLVNLKSAKRIEPSGFESALIVSGVGNPKGVEKLLVKNFDIKAHLTFRDHHDFSIGDINRALSEARRLGVKKILVTEKDAVKIVEKIRNDQREELNIFWRTELSLKLSLKVKKLHEKILALTH